MSSSEEHESSSVSPTILTTVPQASTSQFMSESSTLSPVMNFTVSSQTSDTYVTKITTTDTSPSHNEQATMHNFNTTHLSTVEAELLSSSVISTMTSPDVTDLVVSTSTMVMNTTLLTTTATTTLMTTTTASTTEYAFTSDPSDLTDAIYAYSEWSECSISCGIGGYKSRDKTCVHGCPGTILDNSNTTVEYQPCNGMDPCSEFIYVINYTVNVVLDLEYE